MKHELEIKSEHLGVERGSIELKIFGDERSIGTLLISNDTIKRRNAMNGIMLLALSVLAGSAFADTLIVSDSPTVVRNAEIREAIRQDSTWTSENIAKNPYLFLQDQIANCDKLKAKIEAQNITLVRMEKKAKRAADEATSMQSRYEKFLKDAKTAYKAANGTWPVTINGYDLDEDELNDKIADAMERVELAKKEQKDNAAIAKKVSIRKGVLKTKKRDLINLRMKLVQQAEQVKMNAALAEIGELKASLGTIQDMMIEIDEDPTKLSVEDMTAEDPNAKRNKKVNSFLND